MRHDKVTKKQADKIKALASEPPVGFGDLAVAGTSRAQAKMQAIEDAFKMADNFTAALSDIADEVIVAAGKYEAFHSSHEGFAVLLEEVDELWEEVRKKSHKRSLAKMRKEAMQIGAMAVRFMVDVC